MRLVSVRSRPQPRCHHCPCTGSARHPALICEGNADRAPGRGGDARSCHPCAAWLLGTARCEITGAQDARRAWRLFGAIVTSCATPSGTMRGQETVAMKKIRSGHARKKLRYDTQTLRRYVRRTIVNKRHQPRRNPHTSIGEEAFRRAGNRPHRPRMHTFGGGHRRGLAGLPALKRLGQSIVTRRRQRKPSRHTRRNSLPRPLPGRPTFRA